MVINFSSQSFFPKDFLLPVNGVELQCQFATILESSTLSVYCHVFLAFPSFYSLLTFHLAGGNALERAPPSSVKDFVKEHGGHTVITKVGRHPPGLSDLFKE